MACNPTPPHGPGDGRFDAAVERIAGEVRDLRTGEVVTIKRLPPDAAVPFACSVTRPVEP